MIRLWNRQYPIKSIFKIIIVIALVCLCLFLIYMVFRENYRHHELDTSINKLQTHLKQNGIDAKKTSGCGRPYVEFGRGHKSCAISLEKTVPAINSNSAEVWLNKYNNAIDHSYGFTAVESLPNHVINKDNFTFGYGIFKDKRTHKLCTARFDYQEKEDLIRLSFSCDDTSWFVRTFE